MSAETLVTQVELENLGVRANFDLANDQGRLIDNFIALRFTSITTWSARNKFRISILKIVSPIEFEITQDYRGEVSTLDPYKNNKNYKTTKIFAKTEPKKIQVGPYEINLVRELTPDGRIAKVSIGSDNETIGLAPVDGVNTTILMGALTSYNPLANNS